MTAQRGKIPFEARSRPQQLSVIGLFTLFGVFFVWQVVDALLIGQASFFSRHGGQVIVKDQATDPGGYWFLVAVYCAFAGVSMAMALIGLRKMGRSYPS